ncbi:hypothetical protein L8P27_16735 [Enterobacter asburiae]|uniref:helix-turn-helix transcriptional regulator n=1 Tax=Enterobacter asburiae TaxID=61645 RepID=UPI0020036565|nr:hypothetical protein [Enterobacter asburiae]MCK7229458.1 hypothetical protein [Enterobacter asburiae]
MHSDDVFIADSNEKHSDILNMLVSRTELPLIIYIGTGPRVCSLVSPCFILNEKLSPTNFIKSLFRIINGTEQKTGFVATLSRKEKRVLNLSLKGIQPKIIAFFMGLNVKSVYNYRISACRKLGMSKIGGLLPYQTPLLMLTSQFNDEFCHMSDRLH